MGRPLQQIGMILNPDFIERAHISETYLCR